MEETKREILNDFTGGINLLSDPSKISKNEFLVFDNLVSFRHGGVLNANKRYGFEVVNTNAPTGNLLQIYEYINKTSNFARLIAKTDSNLEYIASGGTYPNHTYTGSYTNIVSGDVSGKVRFLTFQDILYIINRNTSGVYAENKYYDGTNYLSQGIFPCPNTTTLALTDGDSGTYLAAGTYKYLVTFLYENDTESYVVNQSNSTTPTVLNTLIPYQSIVCTTNIGGGVYKKIYLSTIPTGTTKVKKRRIYRTTAGGTIFYKLFDIEDNTTTTFTDWIADSALGLPLDIQWRQPPLMAKYGCLYNNTLFLGNLKEHINERIGTNKLSSTFATNGSTRAISVPYRYDIDNRVAKYYYRYSWIYPTNTLTDGTVTQGFRTKPSTEQALTNSIPNSRYIKNTLTNADSSNEYNGSQFLVERGVCFFIETFTQSGTTATIGYTNEEEHRTTNQIFNVGDVVRIEGMTGEGTPPDGNYTITALGTLDWTEDGTTYALRAFNFETNAGFTSWDDNTGVVSGKTFYPIGVGSIGTAFVDTVPDFSIKLNYGQLLEKYNIITNQVNKSYSSMIAWSGENGDDFPAINVMQISQNDGEEIMGLAVDSDGIVIFKETSIYKLYATSTQDYWQLRKVAENIGNIEVNTIVTVKPSFHIFVCNNIFYALIDDKVIRISDKIQSRISSYGFSTLCEGVYDRKRNWVIFTVYSTVKEMLVLDLNMAKDGEIGQWYFWYSQTSSKALNMQSPIVTRGGLLILANTDNRIYQYGKTPSYDDAFNSGKVSFDAVLQTKYFNYDQATIERVFGKVKAGGTMDLTLAILDDTTSLKSTTISLTNKLNYINFQTNAYGKDLTYKLTVRGGGDLIIRELGHDFIPKYLNRLV